MGHPRPNGIDHGQFFKSNQSKVIKVDRLSWLYLIQVVQGQLELITIVFFGWLIGNDKGK
jgi:hypothetical protein